MPERSPCPRGAASHATRLVAAVLAAALILPTAGCGLDAFRDPVDRAVKAIDQAIDDIRNDNTRWQAALREVADRLPKEVQGTVRNEVTQLVQRSIATAGVEFRCNADFLASRAIQGLQRVRAMLKKQPTEPVHPWVCHMIPSVIDLNEPADGRAKVEIAGYDMDRKDHNQKPLRAVLFSDQTGQSTEMKEERIGRASHYVVNLNVRGEDFEQQLRQLKISKIRLFWGDALQGSNEVLVIPGRAQVKTETAPLGEIDHTPKHTGGDEDFDVDGDEPMSFTVRGESKATENQILVRAYMRAREDRPDFTTVESESDWQIAYHAPAGWRIVSASPVGESKRSGSITDHDVRVESLPQGEVVMRFEVSGDRSGDEAGSHTRVKVSFNPVAVKLEEITP